MMRVKGNVKNCDEIKGNDSITISNITQDIIHIQSHYEVNIAREIQLNRKLDL